MMYYNVTDLKDLATDEQHKALLLEMLIEFDKFCVENGLTYYLSGGTLLGAIRHKGFIPWDDDIDINMPRPDCEKLMELSGGVIGRFQLVPPNPSRNFYAYHWKLFGDDILVAKRLPGAIGTKIYPVFMDIFPIDGLPDTEYRNDDHYREIIKRKELANRVRRLRIYRGRNPLYVAYRTIRRNNKRALVERAESNDNSISGIYENVLDALFSRFGTKRFFDRVIDWATSIRYEDSEFVGVMMTNVHTTEERVRKSEYSPVIRVEFEGHKFSAPEGYDTYLRQLYGENYMEWLPVHQRIPRHNLQPFVRFPDLERALTSEDIVALTEDDEWDTDEMENGLDQLRPSGSTGKTGTMKIAMCGLVKSENLGEMFIARSLEYLIEKELRAADPSIVVDYVEVDLLGRNDQIFEIPDARERRLRNYYGYSKRGRLLEKLFLQLQGMGRRSQNKTVQNLISRVRHVIWTYGRNYRRRLWNYFEMKFDGVDYIVIDGAGLLEYSYNEYHWSLLLVSEYAEKHGKEVVYNAIGRAGAFDERDFGSTILKRALQSPAVTYVSARDNLDAVQACAGAEHSVKLLADSAFWMREAYRAKVKSGKQKIGIGLIRGSSLTGYGSDFRGKDWIALFAAIATELHNRGYQFEFFTNGLPGDTRVGKQVLKRLRLDDSYLVERPVDDRVLVSTINSYRAIVTCRMHSSIAAFTLGVPSVILSWNDKVEKLMEIIGYPERAIRRENFSAQFIVDAMERALDEGIDRRKLDSMKAKALESVTDYVPRILNVQTTS
jgi:lipopolysaccharide cholinephosphotransferase